ncbi:uracil phosphoribosyltransferase [Thiomicrospira aerophila AL3]|uniref:Uracil phosphoribosyltransferase n=1 Tax=Thiomicrospira aerophila AL3 TaxID=717772 RepID=W0DUM2_9GAMM|nr:bifunctional pyr operon transcriptional regulator/uracil phosphoribosyltransferase PyrR [Thiomicrospira aerophila]AHF00664.1 uracil phosphoribosyltransferase [Thiomicrospira aerophila AL3]
MIMPNLDLDSLLDQLADAIRQAPFFSADSKMIGLRTGGEYIALALAERLQLNEAIGVLDSSFYRDDFATSGLSAQVQPSNIPWDVQDQTIILVDDVVHTGRTIRAAMNEIFDYGRPARIILACLIDRQGGRELPIQPDFYAYATADALRFKLQGPSPLSLRIELLEDTL